MANRISVVFLQQKVKKKAHKLWAVLLRFTSNSVRCVLNTSGSKTNQPNCGFKCWQLAG